MMQINDRNDIKDFFLLIENKFPINSWTFDGIHFWPLIRIQLFFYLRKQLYSDKDEQKQIASLPIKKTDLGNFKKAGNLFEKIKNAVEFSNWNRKIKPKKQIFVGHNVYRVNYQGTSYNRFFDTLINKEKLKGESCIIEFGSKRITDLANSEIIISVENAIKNYRAYHSLKSKFVAQNNPIFNFEGYDLFLHFLEENDITKEFSRRFTEKYLMNLVINDYNIRIRFYMELFSKIKPDKITILCYYNDLALVAAANRLSIETVEMQHGAQVPSHVAYGSWSKVPETGYDFLPRTYWSWDKHSNDVIAEWTDKNKLYKAFVGGNLWVEHWSDKNERYYPTDFILYTLQPDSLSIQELFPEQLINVIRSKKYPWLVRLHPRQMDKRDEIKAYLEKNNCYDLANMEQATNDPLPLLLKNCTVHITHSSGSTIEASLFNKKTILLNETGKLYYSNLISDQMAEFIPVDKEFERKIDNYLLKLKNSVSKND
jgi:hypothetical protein